MAEQTFENLTPDEVRSGGRAIRWSPATKRTIYRFCARERLSQHSLDAALVDRLMILLDWQVEAEAADDALYQALAKKLIRFITTNVTVAKMKPALTETDDGNKRYTVTWRAYAGRDDYDMVEARFQPPEGDAGDLCPPVSRKPLSESACLTQMMKRRQEGEAAARRGSATSATSSEATPAAAGQASVSGQVPASSQGPASDQGPASGQVPASEDIVVDLQLPPPTPTTHTEQPHPVLAALSTFFAQRHNMDLATVQAHIVHSPGGVDTVLQELARLSHGPQQTVKTPDPVDHPTESHPVLAALAAFVAQCNNVDIATAQRYLLHSSSAAETVLQELAHLTKQHNVDGKERTVQALQEVLTSAYEQHVSKERALQDAEERARHLQSQLEALAQRARDAESGSEHLERQNKEYSDIVIRDRLTIKQLTERLEAAEQTATQLNNAASDLAARHRAEVQSLADAKEQVERELQTARDETRRLEALLRRVETMPATHSPTDATPSAAISAPTSPVRPQEPVRRPASQTLAASRWAPKTTLPSSSPAAERSATHSPTPPANATTNGSTHSTLASSPRTPSLIRPSSLQDSMHATKESPARTFPAPSPTPPENAMASPVPATAMTFDPAHSILATNGMVFAPPHFATPFGDAMASVDDDRASVSSFVDADDTDLFGADEPSVFPGGMEVPQFPPKFSGPNWALLGVSGFGFDSGNEDHTGA
ncbi:hypothetical protein Tdes44962_MAKER08095 [Teratosphaeria destructans]|uniref:Uncharacterized protein n=1 Tax=Teratosphaeria destructans TaxID=418781 RepID=A0A9W7SX73_9PEZI|nr:hypothetical protein Tdes44962_MAKER08095 [Teratosphaeria destructans]